MENSTNPEYFPKPSHRIVIISPDEASGTDFAQTIIRKLKGKNFSIANYFAKISPRVYSDESGKGKLTPENEKVARELADSIFAAHEDTKTAGDMEEAFTVSCNTLSLDKPFISRTLKLLEEKGLKEGTDFNLITTIDAIKKKYQAEGSELPVTIGTKVMSEDAPQEGLKTLISLGLEELADFSQELIWRVKAVKESEITTAVKLDDLKSGDVLRRRVYEFAEELKAKGIKRVIMGCTELPIAFNEYGKDIEGLELIDPAEIVTERFIDQVNNRANST